MLHHCIVLIARLASKVSEPAKGHATCTRIPSRARSSGVAIDLWWFMYPGSFSRLPVHRSQLNLASVQAPVRVTRVRYVIPALVALASLIAVIEPVRWLARTWATPGVHPTGPLFACIAALGLLWSVASGPATQSRPADRALLGLWLLAMLLRLIGRALAVNVVAGLLIVVDAYLLARLMRTGERPRAVDPTGIAALVALALPFERILQRALGHPLTWASAELTCGVGRLTGALACDGMMLDVGQGGLLIDAPCSGVQGLYLLAGCAALGIALGGRPWRALVRAALLVPIVALVVNVLRLGTMTVMLSWPGSLPDPRFEPWHSLSGVVWLGLGAALVYRGVVGKRRVESERPQSAMRVDYPYWGRLMLALTGLVAATLSAAMAPPQHPPDVSGAVEPIRMPSTLLEHPAEPLPLSDVEERAYQVHGGEVARMGYGPHVLLIARTTSPLRHLHDPVECLRAMGIDAHRLGATTEPFPHGVLSAEDPDGRRWTVGVTYLGPEGKVVTSVSAVVWHWLAGERGAWTQIQWVSPATTPAHEQREVKHVLRAFFDLPDASEGV